MSPTRIERLAAAYEAMALGRGEEHADLLAADFELYQAHTIIDTTGHFVGRRAIPDSLRELNEVFDELRMEPEELLEAPNGEIVVLVHARGRGRKSDIRVENRIAHVWTFRDEQAIKLEVYEEQAEALEAVGLAGPANERS
jgi:ketosteroid isomerase-like protein